MIDAQVFAIEPAAPDAMQGSGRVSGPPRLGANGMGERHAWADLAPAIPQRGAACGRPAHRSARQARLRVDRTWRRAARIAEGFRRVRAAFT
jgi:hypothetical protein